MRTYRLAVAVFLVSSFVSGMACAQSTEAEISAQLVGKPLLLRGFWAGNKLSFRTDGTPTMTYGVRSFTESAIDVRSVRRNGNSLLIEGQRVGLAFDKEGNVSRLPMQIADRPNKSEVYDRKHLKPEMVEIEIQSDHGEDDQPALKVIFADQLADIAASLPDYWQPFARQHFLHEVPAAGHKDFIREGEPEGDRLVHIGGSVKPPVLIKQIDPTFSSAARQNQLAGQCMVYLWVGKSGLPDHIRIAKAVGLGLDENAIAAVQEYRFAPATRDGNPVIVDLYINVNFELIHSHSSE